MILVMLIFTVAFLLISCGDDERESGPGPISNISQPGSYQDCSQLVSGFDGFNPIPYNGYPPTAGQFLNYNPQAVFRGPDGRCIYGNQLMDLYSEHYRQQGYGYTPWSQFSNSPYSGHQIYGSYNNSGSWSNSGEFFNAIPGYPYDDQWHVRFDYWNQPNRYDRYDNDGDNWGFDFDFMFR